MNLSKIEEDFLGDLAQDSHELWEFYAFIRHHYTNSSENEIIELGRELLSVWIERGWLDAHRSRSDTTTLSGKQLVSEIEKLGQAAADPKRGTILLDLTDRALSDVKWLKGPKERPKGSE
ncbi:MAG: hypothetical protein V1721_03335 [Pseudomonadota bacterium]